MRNTYYLKLTCDHMSLRHLESSSAVELPAEKPFSNQRMLVADFSAAMQLLRKALSQCKAQGWLQLPPNLLIQPLERLEGGLSEIEERTLIELGLSSGMGKVRLHIGEPLSDADVRQKLRG